jgi:hypothetical protein
MPSNFDKEIRIIYKDDATGERAERTAEAITKRLGALARASKTVGGKMREARDDAKEFTDELEKLKRQEALARLKAGSEEYTKAAQAARNASRELAASLRPVVTVQDKLNASIAKMKAAEALAKAKLGSEDFAKAQKESKAATAALAAAQKPVITNQEKLNAEIKKTREAAALDKMRAGSAQFAAAQQEAAEASEALRKSLEGVETVQDQVNAKVSAMREERSIAEATLRSKEFRAEKKKQAAIERELESIGKTRQERIAETLEGFENLTGAIDLAVMAGEAFWATWNAGVAAADLAATAANFKDIAGEAAGTSAIVGRGAATRGALRGAEKGLSATAVKSIDAFAEAAARRQVALEGGDFRELVASFTAQFQDEVATGKLGGAFEALGVSSDTVDLAIRNQARAMGVSAEAMAAASKEAILLEQGTLAAGRAFGTFEAGAVKTQASIKSFLEQTAGDIAKAFTDAATSAPQDLRDALAEARARAARATDVKGRGVSASVQLRERELRQEVAGKEGRGRLDTLSPEAEAEIASRLATFVDSLGAAERAAVERLERRIAEKQSAALLGGLGEALAAQGEAQEQISQEGAENLTNIAGIFEQISALRAKGVDENDEQLKQYIELLASFDGITLAQARQLVNAARGNDLLKTAGDLRAKSLKVAQDTLRARAAETRRVLGLNKGLTKTERIERSREAAQQEFQANLAGQATSYDDFQDKLSDEATIRRGLIAEQKAQVDVELQFKSGLNASQLEALKLRQRVAQVADEVSRSTETTNEFNRELGRVILSHTFGAGVEAAERLNVKIGDAKIGLGGVLNVAERLVGALNEASGGKLLSDALKPAKKEAEKRARGGRGGRGGDGGRGDLLARAELAGLDQFSQELIRIQRQSAKDIKTARGDKSLLAAAAGIDAESMADLRDKIWAATKSAGSTLLQAAGEERERILAAQETSTRNAIRTGGGSPAEQRRALEFDAAKRAFDQQMELAQGNRSLELQAQLDFNEAAFALDLQAAQDKQALRDQEQAWKEEDAAREAQRFADLNATIGSLIDQGRSMRDSFTFDDAAAEGLFHTAQGILSMGDAMSAVAEAQAKGESAVGPIMGALDKMAGGIIKNEKLIAVWKSAMSFANAAFAFAGLDFFHGAMYTAAGVQYGAIAAGSPKGGGKGASASSGAGGSSGGGGASRRARTSQTGGGGLPLRRQQQTGTVLNIFVDPLSGQAIVREANGAVSKDTSLKFDKRLSKNSVTRTEL